MATFYYNKSDKRYEKKSLDVVYDNVALTYIDKTDILNPIIKLGKAMDPLTYNYVYIPEFNRYYFVSEPPTFDAGYYTLKLHVDVLMSWKDYINKQKAIIKRNETRFNMYLDDAQYKVQNRDAVRTVVFPSGFNGHQIVLGVVGKHTEEEEG